MTDTKKKPVNNLTQIEAVTVHCAICLQQGKTKTAFTVVKGYAVCEPHVQLVSKQGFDIFQLQTQRGAV